MFKTCHALRQTYSVYKNKFPYNLGLKKEHSSFSEAMEKTTLQE